MLKTMCKVMKTLIFLPQKRVFNSLKCPFQAVLGEVFNIFHRVFHNRINIVFSHFSASYKTCQVKNFIGINKIRQKEFGIIGTAFSYTNCINLKGIIVMIKGVSKQILEVTNPDNPYFEKIIFFVKSEHQSTDREKLQKEAETVATLKQKPPKLKMTKKQIIKTTLLSLLFTLAGCGVTYIITLFF